jgi:hypothetical protein
MVDVSCWAAAEDAEGKKRCADDCLTFLFRLQRFSAFSAASFRAVGRRRRGKTQKRRSNACMMFCSSSSEFSVLQRIQRHHCLRWAAEDAERRRKDTKSLYADWRVCEFACGMPRKTRKDAEEKK